MHKLCLWIKSVHKKKLGYEDALENALPDLVQAFKRLNLILKNSGSYVQHPMPATELPEMT
jgi:hypothetical protein